MKVYYVNQYAVTPEMSGGSRHFELSKEMQRYGVNAEVVAADLNLGTRSHEKRHVGERKPILENADGVPFHWVYTSNYRTNDWRRAASMVEFAWNTYNYLLRLPRPEAIIGSSPHLFAALAAQRAAIRHRVPFVLEVRDIWPQTLVDMTGSAGTTAKALERIAHYLYKRADRIITLARGTDRHLEELGYSSAKITYVPNGVDVERFPEIDSAERKRIRKQYGLPVDKRLFIYAGAHGRANGLEVALDAATKLRENSQVAIVFVGDGTEKSELQANAQREQLSNVHFLNPVSKSQIPPLLGSMDAGLLLLRDVPVFRYGISPNKLFDYWAARLPVIATTPGEIGDLITEAAGGCVIKPEQPAELASAIDHYASRPDEITSSGLAGRAFVQARFSRPLLAQRLATTLEEVAKSDPVTWARTKPA